MNFLAAYGQDDSNPTTAPLIMCQIFTSKTCSYVSPDHTLTCRTQSFFADVFDNGYESDLLTTEPVLAFV